MLELPPVFELVLLFELELPPVALLWLLLPLVSPPVPLGASVALELLDLLVPPEPLLILPPEPPPALLLSEQPQLGMRLAKIMVTPRRYIEVGMVALIARL